MCAAVAETPYRIRNMLKAEHRMVPGYLSAVEVSRSTNHTRCSGGVTSGRQGNIPLLFQRRRQSYRKASCLSHCSVVCSLCAARWRLNRRDQMNRYLVQKISCFTVCVTVAARKTLSSSWMLRITVKVHHLKTCIQTLFIHTVS